MGGFMPCSLKAAIYHFIELLHSRMLMNKKRMFITFTFTRIMMCSIKTISYSLATTDRLFQIALELKKYTSFFTSMAVFSTVRLRYAFLDRISIDRYKNVITLINVIATNKRIQNSNKFISNLKSI